MKEASLQENTRLEGPVFQTVLTPGAITTTTSFIQGGSKGRVYQTMMFCMNVYIIVIAIFGS